MTRDEALEQYRQSYAQYGKELGAEEMQDFENAYRQSAEAKVGQPEGYGLANAQSLESIMSNAVLRARERYMPTQGRIADSQSELGKYLYGDNPADRITSGSARQYIDPSQLGGFQPFSYTASQNPQFLNSIFSQMSQPASGAFKSPQMTMAPNYTYQPQQSGQAQPQQTAQRYNQNTQSTAGQTTAMGAQPAKRKSSLGISGPTVRSRLNTGYSQTGLGLT